MKPETRVQKDIEGAALGMGFKVYKFDQGYRPPECPECGRSLGRGAGGTRQTPGIPDLYLVHGPRSFRTWVEVKAGSNRPTDAQAAFLTTVRSIGVHAFPAWGAADWTWGIHTAGFTLEQLPPWQETSTRFRTWIPCLYPGGEFPWAELDERRG